MGMMILDGNNEIKYELPFKYKVTNFLRLTNIGFNKRGFLRKQYKKSDSSKVGSLNKLGIINYIISSIQKQLPDVNNKLTYYTHCYFVKLQAFNNSNYYRLNVNINLDKLSKDNHNTIDYLNDVFLITLDDFIRSDLISYRIYYNIFGKPIYSVPRLSDEELSEYEIYDIVNIGIFDDHIADYSGDNQSNIISLVKHYNELDESKIKSFI